MAPAGQSQSSGELEICRFSLNGREYIVTIGSSGEVVLHGYFDPAWKHVLISGKAVDLCDDGNRAVRRCSGLKRGPFDMAIYKYQNALRERGTTDSPPDPPLMFSE
jgi:hypothetical protein